MVNKVGRTIGDKYWKYVPYNIANHIVIDIETMGKTRDSALASIGAVFISASGEPDEFYAPIVLESALEFGIVDADTLRWWMGKSTSASSKLAMSTGTYDTMIALDKFNEWCKGHEVDYYWGNSPDFDMGNIEDKMAKTKVDPPWNFRQLRDMRTIMIPGLIPDFHNKYRDLKKSIEHDSHHALSDAILEAFVLKMHIDHIYEGVDINE